MDVGGQGKAARGNRRGGVLRSSHEHVASEAARLDVARALADALDADDALAEAFGDDVSLVAGVLDGVQEGDLADGLRVACREVERVDLVSTIIECGVDDLARQLDVAHDDDDGVVDRVARDLIAMVFFRAVVRIEGVVARLDVLVLDAETPDGALDLVRDPGVIVLRLGRILALRRHADRDGRHVRCRRARALAVDGERRARRFLLLRCGKRCAAAQHEQGADECEDVSCLCHGKTSNHLVQMALF